MKKNILITGASGYVGAMLCDILLNSPEVGMVIGIDKENIDPLIKSHKNKDKFIFVHRNLADKAWMDEMKKFNIDIVIHTAWQIREMYGKKSLQWAWNVDGSDNVFDFVFKSNIAKLVHFSTVASYGAFSTNSISHFYQEDEDFRKTDYLYAEEKRIAEVHLEDKYRHAATHGYDGQVVVIRPAAITGPRGRIGRVRFGLQSALSGTLKTEKSFIYDVISFMVSFVPVTKNWLRQFVHEDDIANIVIMSAMDKMKNNYEVFNVSPPGEVVLGPDMAKAVNKRTVRISPHLIRIAFFFMWHISHGKVPTSRGAWKGYSYPIAVDGSKVTKTLGYHYKWNSKDAFTKLEGRYSEMYR